MWRYVESPFRLLWQWELKAGEFDGGEKCGNHLTQCWPNGVKGRRQVDPLQPRKRVDVAGFLLWTLPNYATVETSCKVFSRLTSQPSVGIYNAPENLFTSPMPFAHWRV